MAEEFVTPPGHRDFQAKKLFNEVGGTIHWGALAYIKTGGGGPEGRHAHDDNHLFIVVEGEVRIEQGNETRIVGKDETCFVEGRIPHGIWNNGTETAKVIKISLTNPKNDGNGE